MGIHTNTTGLRVYRLGSIGQAVTQEQLEENAFQDIIVSAAEHSVGFVDTNDFKSGKVELVDICGYKRLALRVDIRKVPNAVLRNESERAIEAYLKANPQLVRVPKAKKAEIVEGVREKLLTKTLPVPKVIEATIQGSELVVYEASQSALDIFLGFLKKTTGENEIMPITPIDLVYGRMGNAGMDEGAVNYLDQSKGAKSAIEKIEANTYLGRNFLLYLLHHQETSSDLFEVVSGKYVVTLSSRCVLAGQGGDRVVVTGRELRMNEIKAALRDCKEIVEAELTIRDIETEETWTFKVKADTFDISAFKTPRINTENVDITDRKRENSTMFLEKMHLIQKGRTAFEEVFDLFCTLWAAGLGGSSKISDWYEEA